MCLRTGKDPGIKIVLVPSGRGIVLYLSWSDIILTLGDVLSVFGVLCFFSVILNILF